MLPQMPDPRITDQDCLVKKVKTENVLIHIPVCDLVECLIGWYDNSSLACLLYSLSQFWIFLKVRAKYLEPFVTLRHIHENVVIFSHPVLQIYHLPMCVKA